jgi:CHASE2 domain-containing sensor protein
MLLRRLLLADAAISGAAGVLMVAAAVPFGARLELPPALLRYAGLALLPFAGFVLHLARRERSMRAGAAIVIALNAAWVAASVLVLLTGWIAPNAAGVTVVLIQAVAVGVLAAAQYVELRRTTGRAGLGAPGR